MNLSELTPGQGVEAALNILLNYGWDGPHEYYPNWKSYAKEYDYDEEDLDDYNPSEINAAWEALLEYTKEEATDGILTAKFEATQGDGPAHDSGTYFVVLSLTDGTTTRYFKHDGWYASYDGGHLEEGTSSEVTPKVINVQDWETK
jgi:hypothetical protein